MRRSNLFKGMFVKHIGYYANNCGMKDETRFPDVSKYLAEKFKFIDFVGPKDTVHIFETSYGFNIAYDGKKIRVTYVQVCTHKKSSWISVEEEWVDLLHPYE